MAAAALSWAAALSISTPSHAADASSAKIAVGFVDFARVMSEAKPVSDLDGQFKETLKAQQKQLDNLYAGRLLDDKERQELENLQKIAKPSDAQIKRMADLAKLSDDREQELSRLTRLENPSDDERARRTDLSNRFDRQNQRVLQLQDTLNDLRQKKQGDILKQATDLIINAIKAIAQERGLDMVVERQAVLFGKDDQDLTGAVLQRLNGGAASAKPAASKNK
jgi:Skp family chaperone for outer membrane proteins